MENLGGQALLGKQSRGKTRVFGLERGQRGGAEGRGWGGGVGGEGRSELGSETLY